MKRLYWIITIGIIAVLFAGRVQLKEFFYNVNKPHIPESISYQEATKTIIPRSTTTEQNNALSKLATTTNREATPRPAAASAVNLGVPFQAQAPFAEWVEPFKEGCEEASLIMIDHYLRGVSLSKEQMRDEILAQVVWQQEHFGGHLDLPAVQVVKLAEAFYDYETLIIPDLTVEKIKEQLKLGRPVIVPAAGRDLGNPNFRRPGPLYHMLVIKGYTVDGRFITNDPGTRKGADYLYSPDVLMRAAHEWNGTGPTGKAVGIVMYK